MPKKTVSLILALILLTGGLVYLAFRLETARRSQEARKTTVSVLPKRIEKTATLSFDPATLTITNIGTSSSRKSVDVLINSGKSELTGIELELSYDPKVLQNVTVEPYQGANAFFTDPESYLVLRNAVDSAAGSVSFIIGIRPNTAPIKGSGKVARMTFNVVRPAVAGTSEVKFVRGTVATKAKEYGSVLKDTQNLQILFLSSPQ